LAQMEEKFMICIFKIGNGADFCTRKPVAARIFAHENQ
jgi:hypothetical protein